MKIVHLNENLGFSLKFAPPKLKFRIIFVYYMKILEFYDVLYEFHRKSSEKHQKTTKKPHEMLLLNGFV